MAIGDNPPSMSTEPLPDLTNSQQKALREIVSHVRRERLAPGTHLVESALAKRLGTSRSPVRVALDRLVAAGVMRYDRNRGYFVHAAVEELPRDVLDEMHSVDDPLYLRLADARFKGEIPEAVTEADLTRLLGASRADVRKVLVRAHSEGWAEKETGYGWRFLPMIDSLEAYDDMYALRLAIEPAGILNPKFRPNMDVLRELQREQQAILDGGHETMTATERFESNARFHEAITLWSGNRFALQTMRRLDQMRRLAEYRQARQELPKRELAREHLQILDAIASGDALEAANLMRLHLNGARQKKAVVGVFE
jgi:DNA-binding GntR family transcriptional regulator